MKSSDMKRRDFLGASAFVGAELALGAFGKAGAANRSPNETIRIGVVGPGGRGSGLMKEVITYSEQYNVRLTAVCDIWDYRREAAARAVKDAFGAEPKVYGRLEQLLDDKEIDAVVIATADHQHGKMLAMCAAAGMDVYCEKPMANDLEDANRAIDQVVRSQRIVQIGTQRRSYPKYRQAMQLMREGVLGEVVKVDMIWNAYSPYRWAASEAELRSIKESNVDWPAFLMDKPHRPFDARVFRSFRLFRDFSSGIIDQWMTHGIDVVHMLTGQPYPESAVAHGGIYQWRDYRENPDTLEVLLEYGQGDNKFLVNYSTNLVNEYGKATRILGTHGTMVVEDRWLVTGEGSKRRDCIQGTTPIDDAPGTIHHMANWLDCVRRRDADGLYCPVSAGYGHSIACIMATAAYWSGQRMMFDPEKREICAG